MIGTSIKSSNFKEKKRVSNKFKRNKKEKKKLTYQGLKRKFLYGTKDEGSIISKLVIYGLLIGIGFVFLYPIIYMTVTAFLTPDDIINSTVKWIPSSLYLGNFKKALEVLDFGKTIITSIFMSIIPAILQTISCAIVGYGFARFEFPFKKVWLVLLVLTFLTPVQVTLVPKYIMFDSYNMIETALPSFVPALLAQGLKSSIFIFIFYQFFKSYPQVLDEAAEIDGANKLTIFFKIAIPMSIPAIVISFLFSFVWYWNETYLSGLFFGGAIQTLPMKLAWFTSMYEQLYPAVEGETTNRINESLNMAGTLLTIIPLIITYIVLQRQFVESVDKTGIAGGE